MANDSEWQMEGRKLDIWGVRSEVERNMLVLTRAVNPGGARVVPVKK